MEKINVAQLLKDCPVGMELDCTIFENVILSYVAENSKYPIGIETPDGIITLNEYGYYFNTEHAKCIIFPKGKTTWEGFVPPCKFKDGDIIFVVDKYESGNYYYGNFRYVAIFKEIKNDNRLYVHGLYSYNQDIFSNRPCLCKITNSTIIKFATKEQKEKLSRVIEDNGYKWDEKTKTLEELFPYKIGTKIWVKSDKEHKYIHTIVGISRNSFGNLEYEVEEEKTGVVVHYPKSLLIPVTEEKLNFNVGDKIRHKEKTEWACTIVRVEDRYYVDGHPTCYTLPFSEQNDYELVSNKFDITTLIPFESKVLVRDTDHYEWEGATFGRYDGNSFFVIGGLDWKYCIPYNDDTKHLLGKTDDCDDYYKIWG